VVVGKAMCSHAVACGGIMFDYKRGVNYISECNITTNEIHPGQGTHCSQLKDGLRGPIAAVGP